METSLAQGLLLCVVEGCDRPRLRVGQGAKSVGHNRYRHCKAHRQRIDRHGDVQADRPIGGYNVEVWCSYDAAHFRVNKRRGPAKESQCTSCGVKTASGWAYRGNAEHEFTEMRGATDLRYSGDPGDYDPMCSKCHKIVDVAVRRARLRAVEDELAALRVEVAALKAENEALRITLRAGKVSS